MVRQKYNVLLSWRNKFAEFKTTPCTFSVFSILAQLVGDALRGVELQDGCYEQHDNPLAVGQRDEGDVARAAGGVAVGQPLADGLKLLFCHEQPSQDKEHVGYGHDGVEATQGEGGVVVQRRYLLLLKHAEAQGSHQKDYGGCRACYEKGIAAGASGQCNTADDEDDALDSI